jgi:hypothetical protein
MTGFGAYHGIAVFEIREDEAQMRDAAAGVGNEVSR